jgi:hypothetical protein
MKYSEFQQSGKMSPVGNIDAMNLGLHTECTDIITYADGTIIQSLATGGFMYSDGTSSMFANKLDSIEEVIFKLKYPETIC